MVLVSLVYVAVVQLVKNSNGIVMSLHISYHLPVYASMSTFYLVEGLVQEPKSIPAFANVIKNIKTILINILIFD